MADTFSRESLSSAIAKSPPDESPWLWVGLVGGSVVLHLGLLLLLRPILQLRLSAPATEASIPIEFVELAREPSPVSLAGTAAAEPTELTEGAAAEPAPDPALEPVDDASENPPSAEITPENSPVPEAAVTPLPSPVESPTPQPVPTPGAIAPSPPAPPPSPNPQPPPEPPPEAPAASPPTLPPGALNPDPLPSVPDGAGDVPLTGEGASPETSAGEGVDPNLPPVAIAQDAEPTQFIPTITGYEYVGSAEAFDIPEVLPVPPTEMRRSVTADPTATVACILTPESQPDLGQVVPLQVVIGADGLIVDSFFRADYMQEPVPPGAAYVELAQCLVQGWQFSPAQNGGIGVMSDHLIIYLEVRVE